MFVARTHSGANRLQRTVDDLLLEIAKNDGHPEPAEEERRQLGRHQPCACDANFGYLARIRRRAACAATGAPLHQVERIERSLRLRGEHEVGESLLLGAVPLFEDPVRGTLDQLERRVGRRSCSVQRVVELGARTANDLGGGREIGLHARRLRSRE